MFVLTEEKGETLLRSLNFAVQTVLSPTKTYKRRFILSKFHYLYLFFQVKYFNKMAEYFLPKGSPTYLQTENADVMSISQFMAQNLRQQPPPPIPTPPKHSFEISEGESVEIEKIVAAEKKTSVSSPPLFPLSVLHLPHTWFMPRIIVKMSLA